MTGRRPSRARKPDRRPALRNAPAILLGLVLAFWTLLPVYNMLLIALSDDGDEFSGTVWPTDPSLGSFRAVWQQDHWYLEHFWHQFANSIYVGVSTMILTVAIGSAAAFSIGRMRLPTAWLIGDISLFTYAVPASFLAIPFTRIMHRYGLENSLWSVIAAQVMFATPYAIMIFRQYGHLIPTELDDAARIDGASPPQVYLRIYLPLMAPALAAVGTYALLLSWNEYLYQFLLLSSTENMTVAAVLDQFFDSDEAPWNDMMAIAIIYAMPPIAVYYALRRYIVAGLTSGAMKG